MKPRMIEPAEEYQGEGYTVNGWKGIAFWVRGWELEQIVDPDADPVLQELIVQRTGKLAVTMIGDDRIFYVDPEDVTEIPRESYCGECGQIGCCHDGR